LRGGAEPGEALTEKAEAAVNRSEGKWGESDIVADRLHRAGLALSTQYREPRNETESSLAAIWQDVFHLDVVGISDDFFDLGGDSFNATTLAAEIEAVFDMRFTPADIITLSTVAQQAKAVANAKGTAQLPGCLILGRAGGPKPPLFMVHGGKGFAFFKAVFLDILAEDRSTYLFQAPGLNARMTALEEIDDVTTVEEIADLYVKAMRTVQPTGPYHIASICAGAFIALAMCHLLEKAGQTIGRLILLDPTPTPPRIKPTIVKEKKRARHRAFGAQLFGLFTREQRGGATSKQLAPGEMTEKKAKLQRQRVARRVEEIEDIEPDQRSYTAERMFKVSQQFRAALYRHEPRPYPGKAIVLVSSARAQEVLAENAFWPNHLGSMQHKVLGKTHSEVFDEKLAETARFVKEALDG
jgi:thioesterase domain-containing protein/acyl carrier protein